MLDTENLDDFILTIEEYASIAQGIDILIGNKKYKFKRIYLEDYSDGTCKIVLVGENK